MVIVALANQLSIVQSTKSINVLVFIVKRPNSFLNLLEAPDWKTYFNFDTPLNIHLHLNMSPSDRKKGGFKLVYFSTTSQLLFGSDTAICAKQSFYTKTKMVMQCQDDTLWVPMEIQQDIPYDSIKQAQDLTMEVMCLNWAHALLEMVYAFVDKRLEKGRLGQSQMISIPRMRFVDAGLAIKQAEKESDSWFFLLDEVIPETYGFCKYLNNTSAIPYNLSHTEDNKHAQFLSFAQHVQYFKMNKCAYVSDFQGTLSDSLLHLQWLIGTHIFRSIGGKTLLTDPQIIMNGWVSFCSTQVSC